MRFLFFLKSLSFYKVIPEIRNRESFFAACYHPAQRTLFRSCKTHRFCDGLCPRRMTVGISNTLNNYSLLTVICHFFYLSILFLRKRIKKLLLFCHSRNPLSGIHFLVVLLSLPKTLPFGIVV